MRETRVQSLPGLGRSPGGGHGNPLQYSCLENPHGRRSLVGYSPWGHRESDMPERLSTCTHGDGFMPCGKCTNAGASPSLLHMSQTEAKDQLAATLSVAGEDPCTELFTRSTGHLVNVSDLPTHASCLVLMIYFKILVSSTPCPTPTPPCTECTCKDHAK